MKIVNKAELSRREIAKKGLRHESIREYYLQNKS